MTNPGSSSFLDKLIDWALENKFWVLTLSFCFLIYSLLQLRHLSVDAVPDITNVQVVINTKTRGLDPGQVEMSVTRPIELEMTGIPRLHDMRSISKVGLSQVTLIFDEGTDIYWARQQVSERLMAVMQELPEEVVPELAPISTGLGEVFMYVVELHQDSAKKSLSHIEQMLYLRDIQDFSIRPHLRKIVDVADVDTNGGFKKELHINIDPVKLKKYGQTLTQVLNALNGLGESFGGGSVSYGKESLIIRSSTHADKMSEIENIAIAQKFSGEKLLLKDVAQVSFDGAPRFGSATYDGKESILGTVLMISGGNGRLVSQAVDEALDSLELPGDVVIRKLYSRGFLVDSTLKTVLKSLSEGALLVILVLLVVLGHFRAALMVSLVIPFSMLGGTWGMQLLGVSGNLMSLGAIDFGLVVDGAVVLVETLLASFMSLTEEEKRNLPMDRLVAQKAKLVMRPVVFGVLMIMFVYLPILLLEGVEGKMFRPMALTVLLILAWALVATIFIIPVLVSLFIKIPNTVSNNEHETRFFRWLKKLYSPLLIHSLSYPKTLMVLALFSMTIVFFIFTRLGADFIPQLDEGDMVVNITRDASITLEEALKDQCEVEKIVKTIPEVEHVFSRLGTPESATDPMGVHLTDMFLILKKDRSEWSVKNKNEIFERIKREVQSYNAALDLSSTQPIEMRFNEMLEGSRADVSLRIYGDDLSYLVEVIEGWAEKLKNLDGLEAAEMDPLTALRKSRIVDIKPRFAEISRLGISLSTFNQTIVGFMQGVRVGHWVQGTIRYPIVVHLAEELRNKVEELKNLPIPLPEGGAVSLVQVSEIQLVDQVTTIARHWGRRYAALSLNIAERDTMSFVADVKKVVAQVPLKAGHEVRLGGQFNNLERARTRLLLIIPLTLVLILFILWREFKSILDALIIFLCVPFASIGGILALYFREIHLSLSAAVGFIALIGIALLNGIVLITVFKQLRTQKPKLPWHEVVIEGTLSRLRPVVMTAMVAAIGFLPMALNTGLGSEVQKPLATVVIGGILFSSLLTLILLPAFYLFFHKKSSL
jgi:heavy metal efflux system protein